MSRGEVLEPNTVAAALKQLWQQGGFKSKNVVLGMGNQRVLARDLTVPKMSQTRIRESAAVPGAGHAARCRSPTRCSTSTRSPSAMSETGPVVNGLLVAAVKEAVLGNVKADAARGPHHGRRGPDPVRAHPRPAQPAAASPGTVALVEIGANTTSVVIATDGVPQFVRIIPTGGADLTQALRVGARDRGRARRSGSRRRSDSRSRSTRSRSSRRSRSSTASPANCSPASGTRSATS